MKKNTLDMTVGKPERLIAAFALPLLLGNLFQQLFIVGDTMIVGHLLGDRALAAVGATLSIYALLLSLTNGSSSGFSIVVARYFGAKDGEGIKKAVGASIVIAALMTVVLTAIGVWLSPIALEYLMTPADIMAEARAYLQILFWGLGATMAMNVTKGFLHALGNSRVPLCSLLASLALNILLSFWFVPYFGVPGAAVATLIGQSAAAVWNLLFIWKSVPELHVNWKHLQPDFPLLKEAFQLGASIGFGFSIISIASLLLQFSVNGLGVYAITAYTTFRKVLTIIIHPIFTVANAVATFTSQNLGAGKQERVGKGLVAGLKLNCLWSTVVILLTFTIGEFAVRLLSGSSNPDVIHEAVMYMRVSFPFLYALSIVQVYRSYLVGHGRKKIPLMAGLIKLLSNGFAALWIIPRLGFMGIALAEPIGWTAIALALLVIVHKEAKIQIPFKKKAV